MRLLMKFGGTSVADAQCIARVVDILEQHHKAGDEVAVVVSAQRGVTDQLIEVASALPAAKDDSAIKPLIQAISKRHMTTLEGAAPDYIAEVGAEMVGLDQLLVKADFVSLHVPLGQSTRHLIVSGWFESADGFTDIDSFWRKEGAAWKKQGLAEPHDVSFEHVGTWNAVFYDMSDHDATSANIRAHWVQAGTWIDIHLDTSTTP